MFRRMMKFFDWVAEWAESEDFRGCPLQHTVSELTDVAHPARAIARGQREWFAERFRNDGSGTEGRLTSTERPSFLSTVRDFLTPFAGRPRASPASRVVSMLQPSFAC